MARRSFSSATAASSSSSSRRRTLQLFAAAVALRLAFLAFGEWMDRRPDAKVKYTDVDYHVFTDAARCLLSDWPHGSPYDRDTYRYTPFLAYALLPNVLGFPAWGKLLFCLADLAVGALVLRIARATATATAAKAVAVTEQEGEGAADRTGRRAAALWLLNPLVAHFSTRGSADSLVAALVLATVLFVRSAKPRRPVVAGVFHGLAVHVKLYPIVFSLAYLAALPPENPLPSSNGLGRLFRRHVTYPRVAFTLTSAGTFFLLTWAGWALHGPAFLQEGLLHHLTRADNRHNFSPWFYPIYLDFADPAARRLLGLVAFLPQALLLLAASLRLGPRDLPLCLALQTLLFVAFNKVCTAQYFAWYLSVFPAALPTLQRAPSPATLLLLLLLWAGSLGAWLASAYQLEFLGRNTFFHTWLASLAFLAANVALAVAVLYAWAPEGAIADGGKKGRRAGGSSTRSD